MSKIKICYLTASAPWGPQETFINKEMVQMKELGADLLIIPRNPSKKIIHNDAYILLNDALWLPLINLKILTKFLLYIFKSPQNFIKILKDIIQYSSTLKILLKNLAVFPKSIYLVDIIKSNTINHIHAHWGSTTSTMAYIIAKITNIPWSMTLHRWDFFEENNMLTLKMESASFVRCISEDGFKKILELTGHQYVSKILIIRMGVKIPTNKINNLVNPKNKTYIATPANLVPIKGHVYLIQACQILKNEFKIAFECHIIGDGPLEKSLREMVKALNLQENVIFLGRKSNEELLKMYEDNLYDILVLPSLYEGIPVSLMEAMAYNVAVVATKVGGTSELVSDNTGILVPPQDPEALAHAIYKVIKNPEIKNRYVNNGYKKVNNDYNLKMNCVKLLNYFTSNVCG
jgi:glycosyltransferase involved in cell wall biosynthesis